MSYKNILLILNLSTLVLQGQSCIQDFMERNTMNNFEQMAEAIHANRTQLCNGCTGYSLSITIWRDDQYDEHTWTQVKNYFNQLEAEDMDEDDDVDECVDTDEDDDLAEDEAYTARVISLVGEPFKTILEFRNKNNGIFNHFDFYYDEDDDESYNADLENPQSFKIFIEVAQGMIIDDSASTIKEDGSYGDDYKMPIITRSYDPKAWQSISTSFFDFTEKFTSKSNPRDLLSQCCPQLATAFAQEKTSSGIHFSIDVDMTDDTNDISFGCNLDKPFEQKQTFKD